MITDFISKNIMQEQLVQNIIDTLEMTQQDLIQKWNRPNKKLRRQSLHTKKKTMLMKSPRNSEFNNSISKSSVELFYFYACIFFFMLFKFFTFFKQFVENLIYYFNNRRQIPQITVIYINVTRYIIWKDFFIIFSRKI